MPVIVSGGKAIGIGIYTHARTGTVHNFTGSGSNGRALITAAFQAGDTFSVNGTATPAYAGAASISALPVGRWITFTYDSIPSGGQQLNIRGVDAFQTPLSIDKGGTGATTAALARNALGLGNTTGPVPIGSGGTGQTDAAGVRSVLGLGNTAGPVPIENGGTGQTTAALARNALGLGNTAGPVPIENGGTGQTTVALARNALGLGNTAGPVPIGSGGTNAIDRSGAWNNIVAGGGTMTGQLNVSTIRASSEMQSTAWWPFRSVGANFNRGVSFYHDNAGFYIVRTAPNDPYSTSIYDANFHYRHSDGKVLINGYEINNCAQASMQRGTTSISVPANANATINVVFSSVFSGVPTVVLTPYTDVPSRRWAAVSAVTNSSFTITAYAEAAHTMGVSWIALY